MNLMDLLESAGGTDSVKNMSSQLGLGGEDTGKLVAALAPALMRGMQKQAGAQAGRDALARAVNSGGHQRYLDNPELVGRSETLEDGNRILGHIFGSKDVSRNVAAQAAQNTGIDANLIKKALPILAGLAMGALGKKSQAEPQGFDIGMLGGADGDFGLDDVLDLARKFF